MGYAQSHTGIHTHTHDDHKPVFELSDRKLQTLSEKELSASESRQPKYKIMDGHAIIIDQLQAEIVIRTGPAEDMLSFRIQGIRNPIIAMKPGTKLRILFVNVDDDMHHDIRFGESQDSWTSSPDTIGTVGTRRLSQVVTNTFYAEEIVLTAKDSGTFSYFCSVRGHAVRGMAGKIVVGSDPEVLSGKIPSDTSHVTPHVHDHDSESMDSDHQMPGETHNVGHTGMNMDHGEMNMNDMSELKHSLYQIASGTSWVPLTTPMYALMYDFPNSQLMVHGGIFPEYIYQSGLRGDKKFTAPNWFMLMYDNTLGASDFLELRRMFSFDAPVEGNRGYPLLLQTGEGLTDRQHPHDLFAELAVSYTHDLSKDISLNIYGGLPGEPALGSPAFMHRISAMSNPNAPLSHHWQDATHITFGVATLGIRYQRLKIESSVFNGREPDSNRYDIDKPRFDSYSGRISFNPTDEIALQASYGLLTNVEGDSVNVHRLTVSAIYTTMIGSEGWWSSTVVFGQNILPAENASNSILLESQYSLSGNNIYGRAEFVQKERHELHIPGSGTADVSEITLGYSRRLITISQIDIDLGAQATYNVIPESLKGYYGSSPYGAQIYLSIHPIMMEMTHGGGIKN